MSSTFRWKFMFYLLSVSSWFKAIKVDTGWLKPYFSLLSKKGRESEFTKSTHRIHRRLEDKDWDRWNKGSFRGSRNSTWRKCFMAKRAWKGLCHCCCCRHNPDLQLFLIFVSCHHLHSHLHPPPPEPLYLFPPKSFHCTILVQSSLNVTGRWVLGNCDFKQNHV